MADPSCPRESGAMTRDDGGWRRRAWRYVFECPWFKVRQDDLTLPGGDEIQYHTVEHPGWVMVVPLLGDGRVVMERIYRWTVGATFLECPAGALDGETPEEAARRELEEETGYLAGRLHPLGRFAASNGYSDEWYHVFVAEELREGGRIARESTEQMEIELHPLDSLREMALAGELPDAPTALSILLASSRSGAGSPPGI